MFTNSLAGKDKLNVPRLKTAVSMTKVSADFLCPARRPGNLTLEV